MHWNTACSYFGYGYRHGPPYYVDDRTINYPGSIVLPADASGKVVPKDSAAKFMELGIAEDWVPAIQKAGYNLVADMKDVNPQKLHQDICGINKKYKLELTNPSVNDVAEWIQKIK